MTSLISLLPLVALLTLVPQVAVCEKTPKLLFGGKLNDAGEYQEFPGITLISHVAGRTAAGGLWERVHRFVSEDPALRAVYSPLPASSYHMTVFPLLTHHETRMDGPQFDRMVWHYREGYKRVFDAIRSPEPLLVRPRFRAVHARGILGLVLDIPDKAVFERVLGVRHLVTKELRLAGEDTYTYHITLGYKYNSFPPKSTASQIKKSLRELERIIKEGLEPTGGLIPLDQTEITLFNSMTEFRPTDPYAWKDPTTIVPTDSTSNNNKDEL